MGSGTGGTPVGTFSTGEFLIFRGGFIKRMKVLLLLLLLHHYHYHYHYDYYYYYHYHYRSSSSSIAAESDVRYASPQQ